MHVWAHLQPSAAGRTGIGLYPDGMVEHDDMVGAVLKQLDDLGIADNTIVVYGTDNGAETGTWPDGGTAPTPFHGEKGTTWEGGFRVPMLVRWPGVIKPGTVINDIFSQEDWLPTLLAAAGEPGIVEKVAKGYKANGKTWRAHLDGYNFLPFFKGDVTKGPREEIFYFGQGGELNAIRWNDWNRQPARRSIRKGAARIGSVPALVRRQHLAVRAGAGKVEGLPVDVARIPVPAGQQPQRGRYQLQLATGHAGDAAVEAA